MLGLNQNDNLKFHKPTFEAFYTNVKGLFAHLPIVTYLFPAVEAKVLRFKREEYKKSMLKYIGTASGIK